MVDLTECKKAIMEIAVVVSFCGIGAYLFITGDSQNGTWALAFVGGYVLKNGVNAVKKKDST